MRRNGWSNGLLAGNATNPNGCCKMRCKMAARIRSNVGNPICLLPWIVGPTIWTPWSGIFSWDLICRRSA